MNEILAAATTDTAATPAAAAASGTAVKGKSTIFSLSAAKAAIIAHPVGAAVAAGILVSLGAYYMGKFIGARSTKCQFKAAQT